jgi:signal transduction histidine kinase
MPWYRNLPIRTKLQGIVVVTSGVALLLATAGLSVYARSTLLRAKKQELYTAAKMVGANSTAALLFNDRRAGENILGALGVNANVILACTYSKDGVVFARYRRDASVMDCPAGRPPLMESNVAAGHMQLLQSIDLKGQTLGTIFIESDLKDVDRLVVEFLGIVVLALTASIAVALGLASVLQHIISDPIRQLAATALLVDERQDYSIRAQKLGDDEVGALVDAFNRMLLNIHQRDIQLQKAHNELEKRVEERTAHLNALVEDNKKMEIGLRHAQKLEAVGALAAGIAHEINTPIQFVSDNTRFLRDAFQEIAQVIAKYQEFYETATRHAPLEQSIGAVLAELQNSDWDYLRQEIPRAIDQTQEGLARVATIVRAMKDFSHVDQKGMAAADLNQAIQSTLIVARNELKYVADVECEYGKLSPVICSLGDLNQVILNLLVNAAHAIDDVVQQSGQKGHIKVRTKQEGSWVELAISDSGTGIPVEIRDKIFDPFFTTKEVGRGTGQGLAIARSIVMTKHGGTLTFDTKCGSGTTFYVRLPVDGVCSPDEVATALESSWRGTDRAGGMS